MKEFAYLTLLLCGAALPACTPIDIQGANADADRLRNAPLIPPSISQQGMNHEDPPVYLKQASVDDELNRTRITINTTGETLAQVLTTTLPKLRVQVVDSNVDLSRVIKLFINDASLGDYLDYLAEHTGYDFTLKDDELRVSSIATRQWSLAAFSSARRSSSVVGTGGGGRNGAAGGAYGGSSGQMPNASNTLGAIGGTGSTQGAGSGSSGTSTSRVTITEDEDEWDRLISAANAIITQASLQFGTKLPDGQLSKPVTLMAVRSLGIVQATGQPVVIHRLDHFFNSIASESRRQINLNVQVYQVSLNKSEANGINWQLLSDRLIQGGTGAIGAALSTAYQSNLTATNPGMTTLELDSITHNKNQTQAILQFLNQYGHTSVLTQPNITVTNGHTASINNGLKFQVVETVSSTITGTGLVSNAPSFEQVLVGMEMAVTPRLLDDDAIMIDVVPVVSSLQSLDTYTFNGSSFTEPRIELKQLATQVVTRSGRTTLLGGLVTDSLQDTLNSLPVDGVAAHILNMLFSTKSKDLNRTELVISITPRIVQS